MTHNKNVENQTLKIIELLEPALMRRIGKYPTAWGLKTKDGLKASIFNILVEIDQKYGRGGGK